MRANDYGGWSAWNVSTGGKLWSPDPYNKAQKGKERQTDAKEFAMSGTEEYHHYAATLDTRTMGSDEKQSDNGSKSKDKQKQKQKQAQRQNMIKQVVGLVAGSTMIVTSYQAQVSSRSQYQLPPDAPAIVETAPDANAEDPSNTQTPSTDAQSSSQGGSGAGQGGAGATQGNAAPADAEPAPQVDEPQPQVDEPAKPEDPTKPEDDQQKPEDPTKPEDDQQKPEEDPTKPEDEQQKPEDEQPKPSSGRYLPRLSIWNWNEDHTKATATFAELNGDTTDISTTTITVSEVTHCTTEGTRTYTATLTDIYGRTFTTTDIETLPPTGHSFKIIDSNVPGEIHYRCENENCNEELVFTYQVSPIGG